jgi:hypothetical protein
VQAKSDDAIQENPDVGGTELIVRQILRDAAHRCESVDPNIRVVPTDHVQVEGVTAVGWVKAGWADVPKTDAFEPGLVGPSTRDVIELAAV